MGGCNNIHNHIHMHLDLSDPLILIFLMMIAIGLTSMARPNKKIRMSPDRFRDMVASQGNPILIRTTKGFISKTPIYLFPYQGFYFYTHITKSFGNFPDGVTIVTHEGIHRGLDGLGSR